MLERLTIKNYALIDNLRVDFGEGLSIITGETGAGKSVMMGALGLLTGERADVRMLARSEGKASIEALFVKVDKNLKPLFEHLDLDWNDGEVIVRREIAPGGRSRAFVNDTPVTLPTLAQVSGKLVDIHSQNSNRLLSSPEYQLEIIDSMADNADLLARYRSDFRQYVDIRSRIRKIREQMDRSRENNELLKFQLEQLEALSPKRGELEEIERRFDLLSDAEEIRENLGEALSLLDGSEDSALSKVDAAKGLTSKYPEIAGRLEGLRIEIADISSVLSEITERTEADPIELNRLSGRMHELYEAQKRFKVTNADALVDLKEQLTMQIGGEYADPRELAELERKGRELARQLKEEAERISGSRVTAAGKFSERLTQEARELGLKNLKFKANVIQGKLTPQGQDTIEFLCSFNKNQEPMPMPKVASGGEMSRLSLTIKGMLADKLKLPTVVFDEIDTGVSGEIAGKMGGMMERISRDMQVIAITHLPQVAAMGTTHYLVYKTDLKDRTVSDVRRLQGDERVREVARMLSGRNLTEAAIANARSLLAEKE